MNYRHKEIIERMNNGYQLIEELKSYSYIYYLHLGEEVIIVNENVVMKMRGLAYIEESRIEHIKSGHTKRYYKLSGQ